MYNTFGLDTVASMMRSQGIAFFENDRIAFTRESILRFARAAKANEVNLTPHTLGLMAATEDGMELLRQARFVRNGGAVVPDALGDRLVRSGIYFSIGYGLTETISLLWSSQRPPGDDEWQWLSPIPGKKPFLEMRPIAGQDGYYDLICLPGCKGVLEAVKAKDGSFTTGDVLQKHPTKPDRWKVIGRRDDQIKFYKNDRQVIINALTYEATVHNGNEDVVQEVVVFGQARTRLGLLIFTDAITNGTTTVEDIKARIWSTIESKINGKLQTGIDKNMIIVIQAERNSLPQTGKYNLIRARVYKQYEKEIEQAYQQSAQMNGHGSNGTV